MFKIEFFILTETNAKEESQMNIKIFESNAECNDKNWTYSVEILEW